MRLSDSCQLTKLAQKSLFKTLLIMNLTTAFLFTLCLSASAGGFSQQVSLSEKNKSLEKIFKEINRQTTYTFVYAESILKKSKKISITVQNVSLEQVLDICFKDQPLTYTILNKMVVIKEKELTHEKEIVFTPPPPPTLINITGNVKDDKGKPLAGVSVLLAGEKKGVSTDDNGNFSINVP